MSGLKHAAFFISAGCGFYFIFISFFQKLNTREAAKQRALAVEPLDPADSKQTLTAARENEGDGRGGGTSE